MVGIANSANELIPGHIYLGRIVEAVKAGIRIAGGTPLEFSTIGVCDGIAMNHEGMKRRCFGVESGTPLVLTLQWI